MAAELRWILLGLCLPLLAGIWWWTARRTGHASGDSALREPTAAKPAESPQQPADTGPQPAEPVPPLDARPEPARDWGVPPFEPLNIRTGDYDHVPVLDGPMMVNPERRGSAAAFGPMATGTPASVAAEPAEIAARAPAGEESADDTPAGETLADEAAGEAVTGGEAVPRSTAATAAPRAAVAVNAVPPVRSAAEQQRIVTIRVCAVGEGRWSGIQLMAALELHGLAFGRYQVFHRKHVDGRSLFCVASLIEPGTFDVAAMAETEFRGVTLFAVLPGPMEPLATLDELYGTARGLAETLSGMVQDAKGMPLSPQRAAALREDVARFQASLPGS